MRISVPVSVDLLELTAQLVAIPSVSFNEALITDHIESLLAPAGWLEVVRMGNNLVARTNLGRPSRIVLAGHTDTVPPNQNETPRIEDGVLWGIGSCDMKSGVAAILHLALTVPEPEVDVTYVFYACEEVTTGDNGLEMLFEVRPDLVAGDAALLAEPTAAQVEAGCQGILQMDAITTGRRAHTARGWLGVNALHRMAPVIDAVAAYEGREVVIDGCRFREGLQAVRINAGVADNVVPDRAVLRVNHRFAPDRTFEDAAAHLQQVLFAADELIVVEYAVAAAPGLDHPLLQALLAEAGGSYTGKLGWTDVARFAARGIPAVNFGPGDPVVAHTQEEHVTRNDIDRVYSVIRNLITTKVPAP
ncbi:MAG TPA: succinyl-diaminopimelate desuccinylase [Actinomycetota bacterium]|nr:succinyl-diaminopimelate desuccinylase [Actinomycetota bacterium]